MASSFCVGGNTNMCSSLMTMEAIVVLVITICGCLANGCCINTFNMTKNDPAAMRYHHCETWRLNVEIDNSQSWRVIPAGCERHVSDYVLGGKYKSDMEVVCNEAKMYAESVKLMGDGKDAWIFDIDETALSNLAYYVEIQFGLLPFSHESWVEWETQAIAPAIEPIKSLYDQLIKAQWSVFFLSGRHEIRRNITVKNLVRAGYKNWAGLILRQEGEDGTTASAFKSGKRRDLEEGGYRIWGNIGDQWSDVRGVASGEETFKIPNPMYYLL